MVEHNQGVKIFDDFLLKPLHPLGLQQLMARFVPTGSRQTGMVNTVNIDSSKVADFSYLKVLVAEDNLINQEVITALLAEIGISPLIVENGKLALQKLDDESFDLVLMDMQMPVMGGLDATRELRTRPKLSQMPVIALTANAMQKDVADCLAAGMNDHIAKPVDPDILRKVIGKWAPAIDLTPDPAGIAEPGGVLVPDLKRELGLQNCGGRLTLYNSILKKFTEQALVFTLEFEPLYVLGDLQSVIRMAHSLKSSAATIGAESVAATAATLEASLKESLAGDTIMCLFRDLSLVLAALSVAIQREQDGRC
jgi:CheY-like chemotaxis protein